MRQLDGCRGAARTVEVQQLVSLACLARLQQTPSSRLKQMAFAPVGRTIRADDLEPAFFHEVELRCPDRFVESEFFLAHAPDVVAEGVGGPLPNTNRASRFCHIAASCALVVPSGSLAPISNLAVASQSGPIT